ncbi:MAG: hypothetical protein HOP30_17750 [Cyclobacteriaceae bacterium]|nr:hypothetical protein [Cyclobacteriaceae bacterium]
MRIGILFILSISSLGLLGQSAERFKNFHGLRDPRRQMQFFEAEGYDIFIERVAYSLDEKGISKIKKKYSIKEGQLKTDTLLNLKTLVASKETHGLKGLYSFYLIPAQEKVTIVIGFTRAQSRDSILERDFVKSYQTNQIPESVYTKIEIDSINFVGRTIQLGPICHWMAPHNIQCPDRGQMNWAIFDNHKDAEAYRDSRLEMARNGTLMNVKEEEWVSLKFEGQETKAKRTKVKIQLPKLIMGGSNVLVVYYVTAHVRGKFVTCILSHYTDDIGAYKLPPLLGEVLELDQ